MIGSYTNKSQSCAYIMHKSFLYNTHYLPLTGGISMRASEAKLIEIGNMKNITQSY